MFVRPADIGRIKKNGGSDAEQRSLQAMFVQNSRSRRWRVEQIFDRKSLLQSDCSCWECSFSRKYTKNNTAGHILSTHETAAFIIAADYMREHSVGDITDQRAKKLLEACRGYAPATAGTRGEILTVQPKLVESRIGNWSVQFQVGSSRLYKIKDILQFLNDVRDHQSRQYGKNTVFQFGRELLDARGLSWMQFMERAADETAREVFDYIDYVVDGPFVEEKKDLSLRFCGSSNQRILKLHPKLEELPNHN